MNEFQTYEVTTHQRIQGIWLIKRITLVFIYIAFVIAALLLGFLTRISVPLLAFIPIALWLLIFITWRYTDVDYEYSMTSGYLSFSRIYGSRSRKQVFEAHIKSMALIAPYNDDYYEKVRSYAPDVEYYALQKRMRQMHTSPFLKIRTAKNLSLFLKQTTALSPFSNITIHPQR